ncbi:MAG: YCF48-related protein [Opitutaceae bacterium]
MITSTPLPRLGLGLAAGLLGFLLAGTVSAAATHDLYLCGAFNNGSRVMGSKDGSSNGVFVRTAPGTFSHVGLNYPLAISATFDPRDARVFYVACLSGVLRTLDGGATWRLVTGWDETEVKSIAVDPQEPDTVYAGLPDGLVVSRDRGQTWQRAERGLPERGKYTQVVQADRVKRGRVLIGCETGIYLTEDAAKSWRRVLATQETVDDIQQSPHDPKVWLSVTQSAGALISRDGGLTWQKIAGVPSEKALYNVAFDARNAQRLAIASWTYGLLASEDGGKTWTPRVTGLPEKGRVWRTAIDPDNGDLYVAVFGQGLFVSSDFGLTWRPGGMEGSSIQTFTFVPKSGR